MSNVQLNTIKPSEIFGALKLCKAINATAYLAGPAGCGKSEIGRQFADYLLDEALKNARDDHHKQYLESLRGNNLVDKRLATEAPESIKGVIIPVENDDGTLESKTAYNSSYPKNKDWVGVIMFDELPSANPSLQATAYQALNDRCIEDLKFPDGAFIMSAGNRKGDGGYVFDLLKPVANRVIIFNIEPDGKDWVENYGTINNIHPVINSLLMSKPSMIYNGDDGAESQSFASGRSWVKASNILQLMDSGEADRGLAKRAIAGTIGDAAQMELFIHYDLGAKLPSIDEIAKGRGKPITVDSDLISSAEYFVAYSCLTHFIGEYKKDASNEDLCKMVGNMFDYFAEHFKDNTELKVSFVMQFRDFTLKNKSREGFTHILQKSDYTQSYRDAVNESAQKRASVS